MGVLGIAATKRIRRNEELTAVEVRVIDSAGDQAGVMALDLAIQLARDEGLDLVEVSPNAAPPVCRIMDFGKYLFEINKKGQNTKRKTKRHAREKKIQAPSPPRRRATFCGATLPRAQIVYKFYVNS